VSMLDEIDRFAAAQMNRFGRASEIRPETVVQAFESMMPLVYRLADEKDGEMARLREEAERLAEALGDDERATALRETLGESAGLDALARFRDLRDENRDLKDENWKLTLKLQGIASMLGLPALAEGRREPVPIDPVLAEITRGAVSALTPPSTSRSMVRPVSSIMRRNFSIFRS